MSTGNGTQDIFQHDARVSYYSTTRPGCSPTPACADRAGNLMNILLPPAAAAAFRNVWADEMLPAIDDFRPQLLLISAGFDAHLRDPQADLMLETDDFAWITRELHALARRHAAGRVVSMLEGAMTCRPLPSAAWPMSGPCCPHRQRLRMNPNRQDPTPFIAPARDGAS